MEKKIGFKDLTWSVQLMVLGGGLYFIGLMVAIIFYLIGY
jgi:hypothetical protein